MDKKLKNDFGGHGVTQNGLKTALKIKESYGKGDPLVLPEDRSRILLPENFINVDLNLKGYEDPIALAMVAARDPEAPMALAAATRLSPLARNKKLISGVCELVGDASRHELVKKCIELVRDNDFSQDAVYAVRRQTAKFIVHSRKQYTGALRMNLRSLIEGDIAPRKFVQEFYELTEAGNMRTDIRKKLILSLLLSDTIRPSIKFLMLENFHRLPATVRHSIILSVLKADDSRHIDVIKEELRYMLFHERETGVVH